MPGPGRAADSGASRDLAIAGFPAAVRIKFVAERARAVGRRNPCGLFARIVARGWWGFATQGEEERAARWLRAYERGSSGPAAMPGRLAAPGPPARPGPGSLAVAARAEARASARPARGRRRRSGPVRPGDGP